MSSTPSPAIVAMLGLLAACSTASAAGIGRFDFTGINKMVIFGDSLSDYGNTGTVNSAYLNWSDEADAILPNVPGWPSPYNDIKRFTNGNMWSVYVSQKANAINSNFAAITDMDSVRSLPYDPFFGEAANPDKWYYEITDSVGVADSEYKNSPVGHQNWAWGGAQTRLQYDENFIDPPGFPTSPLVTTDFTAPVEDGYSLVSVRDQISSRHGSGDTYDNSTIVFLWAGANDYILYNQPTSPSAKIGSFVYDADRPSDLGQTAAQDQLNNLQNLIDNGATNLVVMNLPDIGQTPAASAGEFSDYDLSPTQYVIDFNTALFQGIQDLETPEGVTIGFVDIYTKFNDMINNPAAYGLDPSLMQQSIVMNENNASDPGLNPIFTSNGYNDEGWLFWDHVHPTENGHEILGNYVFNSIAVPEPTAFWYVFAIGASVLFLRTGRRSNQRRK